MYRWYALSILALTYIFSVMDRQIMSIVLEELRAEFLLSDTQLGLLSGIAFALFYATLGIPIARLADRWHRINIISIAVALWSMATALCGAVSSFAQLFLARVLVGVGEAGGSPPAHSVVSDYFERERRSFAMAIYSLGATLGGVLGLVIGGFITEYYGWRWAFVVLGVPGILLAVVVKTTVREPTRGLLDGAQGGGDRLGLFATVGALWSNLVYRRTVIAATCSTLVGYALFSWLAALYIRQFDLTPSVAGSIIGGLNLACGLPGLMLGGYLADRLGRRDPRWRTRLPALGLVGCFPLYVAAMWQDTYVSMSAFIGVGYVLYFINHAPPLAVIQIVVPPEMRAQAAAYAFFLSNIIGLGLGPVVVGYLSDVSAPVYGEASLNFALTVVMFGLLPSIFWFWRASEAMRLNPEDVQRRVGQ